MRKGWREGELTGSRGGCFCAGRDFWCRFERNPASLELVYLSFPAHTHKHNTVEGAMSFADFLELMAEAMAQTTRWGNLGTKLDGYVGFDTIQEQIRKKSLKRGFEFNLMVVGES